MSKLQLTFLSLLLLLPGSAAAEHPSVRVTVEQLEKVLAAAKDMPDGKLAKQLSNLELTERLSGAKLAAWKAGLPGAKATAALVILADQSAFLDPPMAEIVAAAPPGLHEQGRLISLAADYFAKTIPTLPNLIATRTTVRFEESLPEYQIKVGEEASILLEPLHLANRSIETVLYRNGKEVADSGEGEAKKADAEETGFTVEGTFGPMLGAVIGDIADAPNGLSWDRWEIGSGVPAAVIRFEIPESESHYEVGFCCLPDGNGTSGFHKVAGYHGEVTIDPSSGAILRLAVTADLQPPLPLLRSDIAVEYGPVEIGGKTYICPVRSVSLMRWRTVAVVISRGGNQVRRFGPYATSLNDVAFSNYHIFRAESRILPSTDSEPEGQPNNAGATGASPAAPKVQP
jgi:hypothetical protein